MSEIKLTLPPDPLSLIIEATHVVVKSHSLEMSLQKLVDLLGQGLNVSEVNLAEYEPDIDRFTITYTYLAEDLGAESPPGAQYDLASLEAETQFRFNEGHYQSWHIDDESLPRLLRSRFEAKHCFALLQLSCVVKNRLVGFVELWQMVVNKPFTENEIALAEALVNQIGVVLLNGRLQKAIQNPEILADPQIEKEQLALAQRQTQELNVLNRVAFDTANILDLDKLLLKTTELIIDISHADIICFILINEETGQLENSPFSLWVRARAKTIINTF